MSKIENRCIAYIFDEMDPSERLEFERELQEDENLLIELESLKRVACNLNGLNCIEPPEAIVNYVKAQAERTSENSTETGSFKYLFASAAVTLFAVMIYGAVFLQDQRTASSSGTQGNEPSVSSLTAAGDFSDTRPESDGSADDISPWVDHDEVIHFHERFNRGSVASVDSMFNSSFDKLTRVNSSETLQRVQQQIHLTGSNR